MDRAIDGAGGGVLMGVCLERSVCFKGGHLSDMPQVQGIGIGFVSQAEG